MLAEKYILLLETMRSLAERSLAYADGGPKVVSTSRTFRSNCRVQAGSEAQRRMVSPP